MNFSVIPSSGVDIEILDAIYVPGPQGEQGVPGDAGPVGPQGPAGSDADATAAIAAHNASTTNVHGIANTALLATQAYADAAATTAAANLVDSAPATLDTLNELAAALGDDPNFATTVTNSIAAKADDADLTSHETATTNVHGISDTSLLATTAYVDAAESDAVTTANAYSDSLSSNYDASGTATSEVATHNAVTTNVHGIADTTALATTSYVDTEVATAYYARLA